MKLTKDELKVVLPSVERFLTEELELPANQIQARALIDFVMQELAPIAYNRGVVDAEKFLRERTVDLLDVCFEAPGTYWSRK